MINLNIAGKDYFDREEAAHYACMSVRHWDTWRKDYAIPPISLNGKIVYRKADIARAIERAACQDSESGDGRITFAGSSRGRNTGARSVKSRQTAPADT